MDRFDHFLFFRLPGAAHMDDFIPPAPPMQAPGLPPFEGNPWGRDYPHEGNANPDIRVSPTNSIPGPWRELTLNPHSAKTES